MSFEVEAKIQVVLLVIAALAFLVLSGWFLQRTGQGRWAQLGCVGAGLLGLSLGLPAASNVELFFLDSFTIAEEVLIRRYVALALAAGQAAGALLVAAAFVTHHRADSSPGGSNYGP